MSEIDRRKRYRKLLEVRLEKRTPPGWYGLASPTGWDRIIDRTDRALAEIDPSYEVHQVKEKFGGLRYYCSIDGSPQAEKIIEAAERESMQTCEFCGAKDAVTTGPMPASSPGGWIHTLCVPCRAAEERRRAP